MAGRLTNERGVALVITLFVVALVTVLVLEFHFDANVEMELAFNHAYDVQAYYLALSGVNFARALLQRDGRQVDGPNDAWYQTGLVPVCIPPEQMLALAEGTGGETTGLDIVTADSESTSAENAQPEQGCVSLRISDEQSKLSINALVPPGEAAEPDPTWRQIFDEFFRSFQIDNDRLDALVDWIDRNDVVAGPGGAESLYYQGLTSPYEAPNRPMRTPGELRLVRGFDAETLAKLFPGLLPEAVPDADIGSNNYLTTFGTGAEAKVNVNTANAEVLQALVAGLQGGSSSAGALVEEIIAKRDEAQFDAMSQVTALIPDASIHSRFTQVADVKSVYFRVEAVGAVGVVRKRVVTVFRRVAQNELTPVYFKVE